MILRGMFKTRYLDFLFFQRWSLLLGLVLSTLRSFDQRHYHMTFIWESTLKVRSFFRRVLSRQSGLVYSFDSLESHHHFPVHSREFGGCSEFETLDFSQRLSEGSGDFPTLFSRAQFLFSTIIMFSSTLLRTSHSSSPTTWSSINRCRS